MYLFGKLGQTYRLAAGADLSEKLLHLADGFSLAFESAAPSFHLFDLAVGVAGAVALRLMVYCKSKNAKKYRRGVEYGSARWGGPKDIAPYIDPVFDNNILLTQTERLTMNNRPKDPKTARNNCDCTLFLSGRGKNAKEIAEVLGKETIDSYNQSENRGAQTSHGLNYQKLGKELMSQDEIATMDGGKCILQVRGVRPFFSEKYDITRHPRYKYLSDADKKNTFDVDSYLSSLRRKKQRVVTEDEPFDLYDIELSDEDFAAE